MLPFGKQYHGTDIADEVTNNIQGCANQVMLLMWVGRKFTLYSALAPERSV